MVLIPNFCQKKSELLNLEKLFISDQSAITSGVGTQCVNMWLGAQRNMAGEISYQLSTIEILINCKVRSIIKRNVKKGYMLA